MRPSFEERSCPGCKGTGKVQARTKSGVGRMAKEKGTDGELRVAKMIAAAIGLPYAECRRTPNSGALIERGDLRLSDRAIERFPWFIEVKNREAWDFWNMFNRAPREILKWEPLAWYEEAVLKMRADARNGFGGGKQHPVILILLQNRKPPLALFKVEGENRPWNGMRPKLVISGPVPEVCYAVVKFEDVLKKLAEKTPAQ